MTKSNENKAAVQSNSAVEKEIQAIGSRAAKLSLSAGDSLDPQESLVRGTAIVTQLDLAEAKDNTPKLNWWEGVEAVPARTLMKNLVDSTTAALNKPGARMARAEAPKVSPIDAAIANAEQVRRRTVVATEGSPLEAERNEAIKRQIFADRTAPTGKVRWMTELSSILKAIQQLESAPPALVAMLPMLTDAHARMEAAQPLPPGRTADTFIYSEEAMRAVFALELAIGDLRSWAAGNANPDRYAAILRVTSPKRQSDAKPAAPAAPAETQTSAADTTPAPTQMLDGAAPAASSTTGAHVNGVTTEKSATA
jgi:hypothetical protein